MEGTEIEYIRSVKWKEEAWKEKVEQELNNAFPVLSFPSDSNSLAFIFKLV